MKREKDIFPEQVDSDYLEVMEKAKKQYQEYIEVSGLYNLPTSKQEEKSIKISPPSYDNPLTTNTFRLK